MGAARLALVLVIALLPGITAIEPRVDPIRGGETRPESISETAGAHELHCGLWRVDGGFASTIRIKNSLIVGPLEVMPVLYMADGTEYALPPVHIPISGVATVNVNAVLAAAPPEIARHLSGFGSAALRYTYGTPGEHRDSEHSGRSLWDRMHELLWLHRIQHLA